MVDDDIKKKYDLRTTEGKEAAEEDQVERDEHLKLFREWAIANNRDPEEQTMEALGEFEKDLLEKKETKKRRLKKFVMFFFIFGGIVTGVDGLVGLLNLDQEFDEYKGIATLVVMPLSIWITLRFYQLIISLARVAIGLAVLTIIVISFLDDKPKETNQTKPTSVPSEAVTKKDSSVGLGTDSAGHYEHPDAFAGAVTEKDSSVGVSPDDTFEEAQLKAIEADECTEWDNMDRTWLIMNCTRGVLDQLISSWGANESEDAFNDLLMDFEEKGDIEIRNKLAEIYSLGARPLTYNTANALFQTFKSIAGHNVEAQSNLGLMYSVGSGVGKDLDEALKWDQRAADQGDEDAKKRLLRKERYQPDYDGP